MAGQAIDLSAGMVPTAPTVDLSAGLVPKAPDLTSNAKGEGTYKMKGPDGTVSVPFSKVDTAHQAGLSFDESGDNRASLGEAGRYTHDSTGSLAQALQADFDSRMKTIPTESKAQTLIKSAVQAAGGAVVHPVDTVEGAVNAALHPIDQAHSEVNQLYSDAAEGGKGYAAAKAAGQIIGSAGLAEAGGSVLRAASPVVADAAAAAKAKYYPTSQSVGQATMGARNLARALVVPAKQVENFVGAATDEAGSILSHAQENGLPINSKVDLANAAKSAADKVQTHINDKLMGPANKLTVDTPQNYSGESVSDGKATVEQVNSRLNSIREALANKLRDQTARGMSDQELKAESRQLTSVVNNKVAEVAGLTPQEVAATVQQAGKLRTIADAAKASANADTTAAGRADMGQSSVPMSKMGIIEKGIQSVKGGPEIIGNRQVLSALQKVEPKAINLPEPVPADASAAAANQQAAIAEATQAHNLQSAAQDAAAARAKIAADARLANQQAQGSQKFVGQGYANVLDHLNLDESSGITRAQIADYSRTAGGKGQMVRASKLDPGSPQMRTLVNQIKNSIGGSQ